MILVLFFFEQSVRRTRANVINILFMSNASSCSSIYIVTHICMHLNDTNLARSNIYFSLRCNNFIIVLLVAKSIVNFLAFKTTKRYFHQTNKFLEFEYICFVQPVCSGIITYYCLRPAWYPGWEKNPFLDELSELVNLI